MKCISYAYAEKNSFTQTILNWIASIKSSMQLKKIVGALCAFFSKQNAGLLDQFETVVWEVQEWLQSIHAFRGCGYPWWINFPAECFWVKSSPRVIICNVTDISNLTGNPSWFQPKPITHGDTSGRRSVSNCAGTPLTGRQATKGGTQLFL